MKILASEHEFPIPPMERMILLLLQHFCVGPSPRVDSELSRHTPRALLKSLVNSKLLHALPPEQAFSAAQDQRLFEGLHFITRSMGHLHIRELGELIAASTRSSRTPFLVTKGLPLARNTFPSYGWPFSGDVDLITRLSDIDGVRSHLERLGYMKGLVIRDSMANRWPDAAIARVSDRLWNFGQLPPYSKLHRTPWLDVFSDVVRDFFPFHCVVSADGAVYVRTSFDVHYSLNTLTDDPNFGDRPTEEEWWEGYAEYSLLGVEIPCVSSRTWSWYLAYHAYHDLKLFGQPAWKSLFDLAGLVRCGAVDFAWLSEYAVARPSIAPSVYWIYEFLRDFALVTVGLAPLPEEVKRPLGADFGSCVVDILRTPPVKWRLTD